jgi:hypothetical protein
VKRLPKTQLFEDELKKVSQLNTVLLARNQELEARLTEESHSKTGKHSTDFLLCYMTILEQSSELITTFFVALMEQLMALCMVPSDPNSATKAFADLKDELAKEKGTREIVQAKVDTLTRAVKSLKISADKFTAQIPTLEEKVKHLDNKVIDGLNEL